MIRNLVFLVFVTALPCAQSSFAINYFDAEIYPYELEGKGDFTAGNQTSFSSGNVRQVGSEISRSSIVTEYGVNDRLELSLHTDFETNLEHGLRYEGFLARARTRFYEKGRLPIDIGAAVALEMPRGGVTDKAAFQIRGILGKDYGRFTFDANPIFERNIVGGKDGVSKNIHFSYGFAGIFNWTDTLHPRIESFGSFNNGAQISVGPAMDINLRHGWRADIAMDYSLTNNTFTADTEFFVIRLGIKHEF